MTATGEFQQGWSAFPSAQLRRTVACAFAWLLTGIVALAAAQETTSDEQYLRIYGLISQADTLSQSGQVEAAKARYQEAQAALRAFRERYPTWSPKVVAHRLNYVAGRLAALEKPTAPPTAETADTNRPAAGTAAAKQASLPPGVQFKLLDAGAEPRVALRLRPKPGDTQTVAMTLSMAFDIQVGESPTQKIQTPPLKFTLDTSIASVAPGGDITYQTVVTDVDVAGAESVSAEMSDALKKAAEVMRGMSYGGTMSDRGFFKTLDTPAPRGGPPQLQQALDQVRQAISSLGTQWPEEAVGPGARWQVTQPIKAQGMSLQQSVQAELVSIEAGRVTINHTITQKAGAQKIQPPGLPGASAELLGMTGQGNGRVTFDLTRVMPVSANMESQSETTMRMNITGQPQTMSMKAGMKFKITEP